MRNLFILLTATFITFTTCSPTEDPVHKGEGKVIVLLYHRIIEGEPDNLYERNVEDFESDLKYLSDNKVNTIDFNDLETIKETGKMPEGNSVIITFDDGDNSWFNLVKPLLLKYKKKATFFLWTDMIGHDSFLTWQEVEDMSFYTLSGGERPFVFGSHSFSHPYLQQRKKTFNTSEEYNSFLDYELGVSKSLIQKHSPGEVTIFALPYGDGAGDQDIISAAKRNGYKFIRTSVWGTIDNPEIDLFVIPCLPMLENTSPELIGDYLGF